MRPQTDTGTMCQSERTYVHPEICGYRRLWPDIAGYGRMQAMLTRLRFAGFMLYRAGGFAPRFVRPCGASYGRQGLETKQPALGAGRTSGGSRGRWMIVTDTI